MKLLRLYIAAIFITLFGFFVQGKESAPTLLASGSECTNSINRSIGGIHLCVGNYVNEPGSNFRFLTDKISDVNNKNDNKVVTLKVDDEIEVSTIRISNLTKYAFTN